MAFVDPLTHQLTNAGQLQPGVIYNVFAVIKNEDPLEYLNVQVNVVHSAFGIGLPGGGSYIVQPDPVDVPPALNPSQPGLATIQFQFMAPPAGHGCLTATIVLNNAKLYQNLTVLTAQQGATSTISFLVFSDPNVDETMVLTLQQLLENGAPVAPADRWPDKFVVPTILAPANQTADTVTLHIPRGNAYYSIGIDITIPANAASPHVFFVRGVVNAVDKGSVSLLVKPDPTFVKPSPYVLGGTESPDIVLIDPNGNVVPFFGHPAYDTVLLPNTDYTVRAIVHNSSRTPANNTLIRFWEIPGGLGTQGSLLDIQTITVPGNGQIEVASRVKFHSGPLDQHRCAIVSLYNAQSATCNVDCPTVSDATQQPMVVGQAGEVAWRNTDSRVVLIGEPWHLNLVTTYPQLNIPHPIPEVGLDIEAVLVPHGWETMPEVAEKAHMLQAAGVQARYPAYLLPGIREKLAKVDLGIEVKTDEAKVEVLEFAKATAGHIGGVKADAGDFAPGNRYRLLPKTDKPLSFTISGKLPREAQDGDTILVRCSAQYPKSERAPELRVDFTEALHVMKG